MRERQPRESAEGNNQKDRSKISPLIKSSFNGHLMGKTSVLLSVVLGITLCCLRVVSRSALGKQEVYYPRVSAEAEDVRYTIRGFGVLIKNDFEV